MIPVVCIFSYLFILFCFLPQIIQMIEKEVSRFPAFSPNATRCSWLAVYDAGLVHCLIIADFLFRSRTIHDGKDLAHSHCCMSVPVTHWVV